jgi:probable F420-dependent oxidoreductase
VTPPAATDDARAPVDPGRVGLWSGVLDPMPWSDVAPLVAELDALGYGALWVPEAVGREPFANSALLLSAAPRLVVATGIASIHARAAMAMAAGERTLTEAYPHRFLMGLGVSHAPMVEGLLGQSYGKPLGVMRSYLDAMDQAFSIVTPPHAPQRVLAALGPKMTALAAERTSGVLSYFVPVEHTAVAREVLGPEPLLCVEQAVVLEPDRTRAREIARKHTQIYTTLPNYTNNLRRFGLGDDDFADAGSDRLVDEVVAQATSTRSSSAFACSSPRAPATCASR